MKKFNPCTPGTRGRVTIGKNFFTKKVRYLRKSKKCCSGRNNQGLITVRHRGGGVKRSYRIIDFKRRKCYVYSVIKSIEYDPNRNSLISLISYSDGTLSYIPYINGLFTGCNIVSGDSVPPETGNSLSLKNIPLGTKVCCIESSPGKGAVFSRSAGSFSTILSYDGNYCYLRMSSGRVKTFNPNCFATIGEIGNSDFYLSKSGKAGIKRHKGIRPTVRGVAMNPVDHPHGGGEGKTSSKRNPVSPKGILTKGYKTRRKKFIKFNNTLIK
ncbi:50S ribosomal protein L2 [Candidatus Vidania fulgoroideorum]